MKNLSEQILRFKQLSGLINEENTDDIKVGDYFKLLSSYGTKYGKITKLNDISTFPFYCTIYIFFKGTETFLLFDRDPLGKEDLEKIEKIDKSEFIETAKNFLEGDNVIIQIGNKKVSLDDLIKVLPEFKEISSQTNNNNNTETITASKTTQNQTTPTTTQNQTTTQKSNEKELTTDEVDALKTETSKISELTTQEKNVITQTLSSPKKLKLSDITKVIKSFNNKNKDSVIEKITDYIRNTFPKLSSKQAATIDNCETQINNFYNLYIKAFDKYVKNIKNDTNKDLPDTIELFDSNDEMQNDLKNKKENVNRCVGTYQKKFNRRVTEKFNQLLNITPKLEKYFEIKPIISESINIYNKNKDMSLSLSIKKVLKEHSEKNVNKLVEKQIIENKINFVLETTNNNNRKSIILKEANNLLKKGFDKNIIKEKIKNYLI